MATNVKRKVFATKSIAGFHSNFYIELKCSSKTMAYSTITDPLISGGRIAIQSVGRRLVAHALCDSVSPALRQIQAVSTSSACPMRCAWLKAVINEMNFHLRQCVKDLYPLEVFPFGD